MALHHAGSNSALVPLLRTLLLGACVLVAPGCKKPPPSGASQGAAVTVANAPASTPTGETHYEARPGCDHELTVFEGGRGVGKVCADEAGKQGLTVIDLGDGWAPSPFDGDPSLGARGKSPYRETLVALENEAFSDAPEFDRAKDDKYLELYGIFPSFTVLAKRLADDERHQCHQAVDNDAILAQKTPINPWRERAKQQSDWAFAKTLKAQLEAEKKRRDLGSIDELKDDKYLGKAFAQYERVGTLVNAISRVQEHLKCERLLKAKAPEGIIDYASAEAIKAFQRKNMIVSWELDPESLGALATDTRELDYRSVLRSLRERVVDATGLIEDGSARNERKLVLGRQLDAVAFRTWKDEPLEGGASDLISPATETAAKALGWTGPAETRAFFTAHAKDLESLMVAVKLPAAPSYHSAKMELRAVVDRGDVNYDFPWTARGELKLLPVEHRPTLVLFAKEGDHEIALMRWPTTIGGWKAEKVRPRQVQMVYKESPPGERILKDLIVSPVWVPPENAPKRELVRARYNDTYVLNTDLFGPGYASAFGLVKLVHLRVAKMRVKGQEPLLFDEGIGTHGSVSYDSIHHGSSHGCHRLFNHQSMRLGAFLLHHRAHQAKGTIALGYGRQIAYEHKALTLKMENGGFRYELDPPLPVEVLRGRIVGRATVPPRPHQVPDAFLKLFVQERFED